MTTEADVSKGAGTAIGVAAATCSALPGIGTATCAAAAAIASAFVALGVAISSGLRDTYHPNAATALSWLTVWQFLPTALWTGNDTLTLDGFHNGANLIHPRTGTPAQDAVRLVRYSLILAGLAKPSSPLYNPGDKGESGGDANPYLESQTRDPHHPLTDLRFVRMIYGSAKAHGVCSDQMTLIRKPHEARDALRALRSPHFDANIFTNWPQLGACLPALRRQVARARRMVGEHGPDARLDRMLGGSTAPSARPHASHHDRKVAGIGSAAAEGLGFGLGLVPGLFVGGSLVALGVVLYQRIERTQRSQKAG